MTNNEREALLAKYDSGDEYDRQYVFAIALHEEDDILLDAIARR